MKFGGVLSKEQDLFNDAVRQALADGMRAASSKSVALEVERIAEAVRLGVTETIGEQLGPDVGDALSRALAEAGSLQTAGAQARPSGAFIDQVAEKVEVRVIETLRERVGKAIRERLRESLQRNPSGGFQNR